VNKQRSVVEERRKVKGGQVIGRHAMVLHRRAVEIIASFAAHFTMSCVQDVRDTQLPQSILVMGRVPGGGGGGTKQYGCIVRYMS